MSGATFPVMQCHIPGDLNHLLCCCENLRPHKVKHILYRYFPKIWMLSYIYGLWICR